MVIKCPVCCLLLKIFIERAWGRVIPASMGFHICPIGSVITLTVINIELNGEASILPYDYNLKSTNMRKQWLTYVKNNHSSFKRNNLFINLFNNLK